MLVAQTSAPRLRVRRRRSIGYRVKSAVASVLYYSGLLGAWQALVLRRRAVVLMYHRVLTAEERERCGSHPGIVVDRETFAWQMSLLKERFVPLSVDEFSRHLEAGQPFASSSCLVTFDDGWLDNYTNAWPVLRQTGVPAVIFLAVNYIGSIRMFWREGLTHLLVRAVLAGRGDEARRVRVSQVLATVGLESVMDVSDADPRSAIIERVSALTARKPVSEHTLRTLAGALGTTLDPVTSVDAFMTWEQVESMESGGVRFGGHGAEHRLLTEVPEAERTREIAESAEILNRQLGAAHATAFAYPNGSWNRDVVAGVREWGYEVAFTTEPGFVRCSDDRFTVRRVNIHEDMTDTPAMFLARVVGLF